MTRKITLLLALFALSTNVSAGCISKSSPAPKPATDEGPDSVLECMDRCKPDGVHLYQPCYDACTRYVDARAEYEDASGDWSIQTDAVPDE